MGNHKSGRKRDNSIYKNMKDNILNCNSLSSSYDLIRIIRKSFDVESTEFVDLIILLRFTQSNLILYKKY